MTRSAQPIGCGIDFSASNSSVAIAYADRVDVLPIGPARSSRTLPSLVYLHRAGRRTAGDETRKTFRRSGHEKTDCWKCPLAPYGWDTDCRQYRKGGGSNDARLLSALGLRVTIQRAAFESMIRPELELVAETTGRALDEAGIRDGDVDRVLLTGGSAYIPAFRANLAAAFGEEKLEQRDASTAVVHGLGVPAKQLWGAAEVSPPRA